MTALEAQVARALVSRRRVTLVTRSATAREREVLAAIAEGRTNHGIAEALFMSPKTVETHIRSIFQKLDLVQGDNYPRRVVAAVTWLREQ